MKRRVSVAILAALVAATPLISGCSGTQLQRFAARSYRLAGYLQVADDLRREFAAQGLVGADLNRRILTVLRDVNHSASEINRIGETTGFTVSSVEDFRRLADKAVISLTDLMETGLDSLAPKTRDRIRTALLAAKTAIRVIAGLAPDNQTEIDAEAVRIFERAATIYAETQRRILADLAGIAGK